MIYYKGCPRLPALSFDLKLAIESVDLCEKIPNVSVRSFRHHRTSIFPVYHQSISR